MTINFSNSINQEICTTICTMNGAWTKGNLEDLTWLGIIVALLGTFKLANIFKLAERLSTRRLTFLKEVLALDALDTLSRGAVIEELNQIVYRRTTGITADKTMRERIDFLLNASKGEIRQTQFSRAGRYLQIHGGKLVLKITAVDKIESFMMLIFAGLSAFFAILFIIILAVASEITALQVGILLSCGMILFLLAPLLASQSFSYTAAKHLQPEIKRLQESELILPSTGDQHK